MVDPNAPLFVHPQEVWDAAKCKKMANHRAKDGLGTPYPFKGYLGSGESIPPDYGPIRYNGGCLRLDHEGKEEWYQGEDRPLPKIAEGFRIVYVSTWGWKIEAIPPHENKPDGA